jgi:transposase
MSEKQRYETQRMDHHGIVAGICHEVGLVEQIDQIVGRGERKVSCGEATLAMVLNGLGFSSRALYLMTDFLRNKPVDLLTNPNLTAEDFNDDTLGRALDDLYEHGVTEVFAGISARAMQTYGIETEFRHLDSSSMHLHGEYERTDTEEEVIAITHGYSRDHRPDLKQVIVQLITMEHSRLPVWLEVLSGNSSDKSTFVPSIKAYCEQLEEEKPQPYFVMDSAGYSEENLKDLGKTAWLTRVPETLSEAKKMVRETDQGSMNALREGYFGRETDVVYGGIKQRWLVVFSEAAYQRELKTLDRARARELKRIKKEWRKLKQVTFKCEPDAEKACKRFNRRKYH